MRRIRLKRKQINNTSIDYNSGLEKFKTFITINRAFMNNMPEDKKVEYIFMGGFYSGCHYKKGENNVFI